MAMKRTKRTPKADTKESTGVRGRILQAFVDHWMEEGHPPRSARKFCNDLGITEGIFFKHFPSLHAVEKAFWRAWISGVIHAVEQGDDWSGFSARERYLAFLFALTQSATENRSLLLERFHDLSPVTNPPALEGMRHEFKKFAETLLEHGKQSGEIADRRGITNLYPGILYAHLRWVIDQYLRDESEGFERTDAFIEKTVALAFNLFRSQALDSAADLIRFLLPSNPWSASSCRKG